MFPFSFFNYCFEVCFLGISQNLLRGSTESIVTELRSHDSTSCLTLYCKVIFSLCF